MKKTYLNPQIEVVKIHAVQMLTISATDEVTGVKITDYDGETGTMEGRYFDFDEEEY